MHGLILPNPQLYKAPSAGFMANAVDFDGTNDATQRTSALTGGPTSGQLSMSVWLRTDGGNGSNLYVFDSQASSTGSGGSSLYRSSTNGFEIDIIDEVVGAGNRYGVRGGSSITSGSGWHNILLAYDVNAAVGAKTIYLYIDNVAPSLTVLRDQGIAFQNNWGTLINRLAFASQYAPVSSGMNGCIAEAWIAPGVLIDFSNSANRAKFILAGKPVDPGPTGALPTGTAPLIYFKSPAASVNVNSGTGGNFTIVGAPATCSTSPSS